MKFIQIVRLFNLRRDLQSSDAIDATIRQGVTLGGTNMWILMLAILTASIGLNVNSIPVIIGAMLISPLMGPIIALGYGAAGNDADLMREAGRNLAIFVVVSLFTSTLYFFISPLNEASSELLARTSPTLWDVLIAFVGGAAGIVAISRKNAASVGNVMPGVAIATALMPPLCTAGYGIAHMQWWMTAGALYLLFINAVFIAFATLLLSRLMRITVPHFSSEAQRQRSRVLVGLLVLATALPSAYLAYKLVQEQVFKQRARSVIQNLQAQRDYVLIGSQVDAKKKRVEITLGGKPPPADLAQTLSEHMQVSGTAGVAFDIRYVGTGDAQSQQILAELMKKQALLQPAGAELAGGMPFSGVGVDNDRTKVSQPAVLQEQVTALYEEIKALQPLTKSVLVAKGYIASENTASDGNHYVVVIGVEKALNPAQQQQLQQWLGLRYGEKLRLQFVLTEQ